MKVWTYYENMNDAIDDIKDNDVTYAFQLYPSRKVKEEVAAYRIRCQQEQQRQQQRDNDSCCNSTGGGGSIDAKVREDCGCPSKPNHSPFSSSSSLLLDSETKAVLDRNDEWEKRLMTFLNKPTFLYDLLNERRSSHEERRDFYGNLLRFIQKHKSCTDAPAATATRINDDDDVIMKSTPGNSLLTLKEVSDNSTQFKEIRTPRDLAILEYCASKFLSQISRLQNGDHSAPSNDSSPSLSTNTKIDGKDVNIIDDANENGLVVQIKIKKCDASSLNGYGLNNVSSTSSYASNNSWRVVGDAPIVVRISPTLTVMDLRRLIGHCLSRALKLNSWDRHHNDDVDASSQLSPEMSIMRQVAISYESSDRGGARWNSRYFNSGGVSDGITNMGSVTTAHYPTNGNSAKQPPLAKFNDNKEKKLVADLVGEGSGAIVVSWPPHLNDMLDESVLSAKEKFLTREQRLENEEETIMKKKKGISIMNCIEKYCEMEQLDESDMWYCNKCKKHVRAWKQFSLFRTPPILIVHLKRFHYSPTTHRRNKIDTLIDFPLMGLDLRGIVKHNWEDGKEPIYDCYAVSNHFGGLGGGHYTAYARADDGIWCNFDDGRVTSGVDESEVVSSAAYCLYYKRKDVVSLAADDNATAEENFNSNLPRRCFPVSPFASPCHEVDGGSPSHGMQPFHVQIDNNCDDAESADSSTCSYATPVATLNDSDDEMPYGQC
jgi:hypothetical protein